MWVAANGVNVCLSKILLDSELLNISPQDFRVDGTLLKHAASVMDI